MIPVFNATVAGEKLSIYEQEVHAKHPLDGLKLENSTELFLMEGPITVLDDGTYAGDSLIDGIPPGDDRLLSYALDVEVEISPESDPQPEQITEMRVVNGTLYVKTKQRRQQHYRIKNTDTEARSVLIEHPRQSGWNLVEPQEPFATTRDSYRLKAAVPGGETKTVTLVFERSGQERIVLTNVQTNTLLQYKSTKGINPQVREALAEVMRRKQEIAQLQSEKKQAEEQLDEIANQQERIRKNMAELDKTTDLYQRYLKKLTEDEDQIEKLRNKIDTLAEEIQKKQNALNEYLQNLSVSPG